MSDHGDGDWASELAEGIFEVLFWTDAGPNWFTITLFIIGLGFLGWHYLG